MPFKNSIQQFNQINFKINAFISDDHKNSEDGTNKRNKRRSKNDNEGRNHSCTKCGKSYLSYPALYTHIKIKHQLNGLICINGKKKLKNELSLVLFIYMLEDENSL